MVTYVLLSFLVFNETTCCGPVCFRFQVHTKMYVCIYPLKQMQLQLVHGSICWSDYIQCIVHVAGSIILPVVAYWRVFLSQAPFPPAKLAEGLKTTAWLYNNTKVDLVVSWKWLLLLVGIALGITLHVWSTVVESQSDGKIKHYYWRVFLSQALFPPAKLAAGLKTTAWLYNNTKVDLVVSWKWLLLLVGIALGITLHVWSTVVESQSDGKIKHYWCCGIPLIWTPMGQNKVSILRYQRTVLGERKGVLILERCRHSSGVLRETIHVVVLVWL